MPSEWVLSNVKDIASSQFGSHGNRTPIFGMPSPVSLTKNLISVSNTSYPKRIKPFFRMLHRIIQQVSNYLRKTAYDPYKNLSRDILLTPKQPFQADKVASNYKSHPSFRASKY